MSLNRPLRGACHCGRNRYIIQMPSDATEEAQVRFNTEPLHQISFATPLAAFVRVPLSWLSSSTHPLFSDETHSMIRRVYSHPEGQSSKRHFCGFCGTPLSYWSENPLSEAEYISLTLGTLLRNDLCDLDDLGLIPEDVGVDAWPRTGVTAHPPRATTSNAEATLPHDVTSIPALVSRKAVTVPWFDALVEGTRLGSMRYSYGTSTTQEDGRVRAEWEIMEWTHDPSERSSQGDDSLTSVCLPKRKRFETEEPAASLANQPDKTDL